MDTDTYLKVTGPDTPELARKYQLLYDRCFNRHLPMPKTPPLGIFPNKKFAPMEITLHKGDMLLLYTDGVTEAFNSNSEMYGTERLPDDLRWLIDMPVDGAVNSLYQAVKDFAGEEPQSDDITMLLCRYLGK